LCAGVIGVFGLRLTTRGIGRPACHIRTEWPRKSGIFPVPPPIGVTLKSMAIIISKKGKSAVKVEKFAFDKEDYLQQYIHENPESIH